MTFHNTSHSMHFCHVIIWPFLHDRYLHYQASTPLISRTFAILKMSQLKTSLSCNHFHLQILLSIVYHCSYFVLSISHPKSKTVLK